MGLAQTSGSGGGPHGAGLTMLRAASIGLVLLAAVTGAALPGAARAQGLSLSPVGMTVDAPAQMTTLTLRAEGQEPMPVQIRIVRWERPGGTDRYSATRDVVASPPAAVLGSGQELTVRIVRTATTAVTGRECYRVVVDQLPGAPGSQGNVQFAIRHSLPLCFVAAS